MLIPDTRAADRDANYQGFGSAAEQRAQERKLLLETQHIRVTAETRERYRQWVANKEDESRRERAIERLHKNT